MVVGVVGIIGMAVVAAMIAVSYTIVYWERIYPGVHAAGIDLGNTTVAEARQQLVGAIAKRPTLRLKWNNSEWQITPQKIDWSYDVSQTLTRAKAVGREGNVWKDTLQKIGAWRNGTTVDLIYSYDPNKLQQVITEIAGQIDIPVKEPEISVDKSADQLKLKVSVTAGKNGQVVEDQEFLERIKAAILLKTSAEIMVPVKTLTPKLSVEQVKAMENRVAQIYDRKISLDYNGQNWDLTGDQLVGWLDPTEKWKQSEIAAWIKEFAVGFDKPAQNAFFRYENGRVQEFKPGTAGVAVDQNKLAEMLIQTLAQLEQGQQVASLNVPVIVTEPAVKTADVNNLGIKELVGKGESRFTGSIPNRMFNIGVAARKMDGVLVAPGEVFSFDKHVGDISVAGGYKPGYIIKEGKTVLGDGGGVCQVSSTMFRAALNAGLPIEERWAHAYRVSYYELDIGPGYDATIFTPSVDLKWKNDTGAYILIQTKFDEANAKLAFELYGTSDGRKVAFSPTRVWDRTAPPPTLYQDDPTLPKGVIKLTEHAIYGSKVAFDWTVTRGTEVLQQRTWFSNFQPWQGVYLVGTKI